MNSRRVLAEETAIMNELAPYYRNWLRTGGLVYTRERECFVEWLWQDLDREADASKLHYCDLGCGTGELLEILDRKGCQHLTGLDLAEGMLVEARRHVPDAQLIQGSVESAPLASGSFDVLLVGFSLHHLQEPRQLFITARRLLAPGGRLYLLEFDSSSVATTPWARLVLRIFTAPARLVLMWKNRKQLRLQPQVEERFNSSHRAYNSSEIQELAAGLFKLDQSTHGFFSPWFQEVLWPGSAIDRKVLEWIRRLDMAVERLASGFFIWSRATPEAESSGT